MEKTLQIIYDGILDGQEAVVADGVSIALNSGLDPTQILNESMIAAMAEVGQLFEDNEYFVPEMMIAARAMKGGLKVLKPHLVSKKSAPAGRVVIGSVRGDMHNIGKNLIGMMLEGGGFEVMDIGVDLHPADFVQAFHDYSPDVIGLSAMLTTTMEYMANTIEAFETAGLRDKVKIIVGGAPVTEEYSNHINADGYAPDAIKAVKLTKRLTQN